jgi:hypothetical protein
MRLLSFGWLVLCSTGAFAQTPRAPDIDAQRAAMKKLSFLKGKWSGEARLFRGAAEPTLVTQTEEAQYKLDGLLLVIEGVGRNNADGKPILQAFGTVSYDDETHTYHMRAYNDGRYLETEISLAEDGKGLTWGFAVGPYKSATVLRINEAGEWTEHAELTVGDQHARPLMDLAVKREK